MANYCTTDEVVAELQKDNAASDIDNAAIDERIVRVKDLIDDHCGHSFDAATIANEIRRGDQVRVDGDGNLHVTVAKANVRVLTSASYSLDMRTWTALAVDAVDIDRYTLVFVQPPLSGARNDRIWIKLGYSGGYMPTQLPRGIVTAACRWTAYLYSKRAAPFEVTAFPDIGQIRVPSGVPTDIFQALEPWRRTTP